MKIANAGGLWKLTSETTPFKWGKEQEEAFKLIKQKSEEKMLNTHFDPDKPCDLVVDGSKEGICAVLLQDGQMVRCISRTLKGAEKNYAPVEFEMVALVYGCTKF